MRSCVARSPVRAVARPRVVGTSGRTCWCGFRGIYEPMTRVARESGHCSGHGTERAFVMSERRRNDRAPRWVKGTVCHARRRFERRAGLAYRPAAPPGLTKEAWPKAAYAVMTTGDYGATYRERAEICDLVRGEKITAFAIASGDQHSLWTGYATSELPPGKFDPVDVSFVGRRLHHSRHYKFVPCRPWPVRPRPDRHDDPQRNAGRSGHCNRRRD